MVAGRFQLGLANAARSVRIELCDNIGIKAGRDFALGEDTIFVLVERLEGGRIRCRW